MAEAEGGLKVAHIYADISVLNSSLAGCASHEDIPSLGLVSS